MLSTFRGGERSLLGFLSRWQAWAIVGGGAVLLAGVAFSGYVVLSRQPHVNVGSNAQRCAGQPAKLATLFSDGQTTMIRLSNPDYTDMSVLQSEQATVLPGMFQFLMALSVVSSKLAYVTASNDQLSDAHIKVIDTGSPATATDLATIPSGLWTAPPAWSGDGKKLAFVRLDSSTSPAGYQLWVADTTTQPATVAEQSDLVADNFTNGRSASICWASDNRVVLIPSVPQGFPSPSPIQASAPPPASASPVTGSRCGVPIFSQNDPAWQAAVMKAGADTIGAAGCALTSTAMLLNYYGASLSPAQLNACLGGSADPIDWKAVPACASNLVTGGDRIDFAWPDLDALLASGRPAIVGMLRGLTGSHFVVVTSGGGGLAQNYHITDPWDATTHKTLGSYIAASYVPASIITYNGPAHNCARLVNGLAPVGTGVNDGQTGQGPVTVHFGIDLSKIALAQWVLVNGGNIDPSTVKVPFQPQKLTDGMTFTNDGVYQLIVVVKGPPPIVQIETFTIDHSAPVVDLSLLNPRSFGAIDAQLPGGASVVSSKYPGVDKPGRLRVSSGDTLSGVKMIQTSLDGAPLKGYSNDNLFNPVLIVSQSGDHSLRIVSTDAAGNVKNVTKYFSVFGAVPKPTPSPTPKPTPTSAPRCPTVLTGGSINAIVANPQTAQYYVYWKSSGGCAPYSGTITASICSPDASGKIVCLAPYWTQPISTPTGSRLLSAMPPCYAVQGFIRFSLTLRDSFRQTTSAQYGDASTTPYGPCIGLSVRRFARLAAPAKVARLP